MSDSYSGTPGLAGLNGDFSTIFGEDIQLRLARPRTPIGEVQIAEKAYELKSLRPDVITLSHDGILALARETDEQRILAIFPDQTTSLSDLFIDGAALQTCVCSGNHIEGTENPKPTHVIIDLGQLEFNEGFASISKSIAPILHVCLCTTDVKSIIFYDSTGTNQLLTSIMAMKTMMGDKAHFSANADEAFALLRDLAGI